MSTPIISIHRNKKREKSINTIKKLCLIALFPVLFSITCNKGNYVHAGTYNRGLVVDTLRPGDLLTIKLTALEVSNYANYLNYIAQKLRSSDLQSKEVAFITDSLITPMYRTFMTHLALGDTVKTKK